MFAKFMRIPDGLGMGVIFGLLVILATGAVGVGSAQAMNWCGENGMIRFSFVENEISDNIHQANTENGVTKVTLYAWLTDVDPVSVEGVAFEGIGGFEFKLLITGARGHILNHKMAEKGINVSKDKGGFVAGLAKGLPLKDGRALLATWELMFQGEVKDVMFSLDPEGMYSCRTCAGCPESESQALYIGTDAASQLLESFGAGCVPAWLNPTDDPDTTPMVGKSSWVAVGRAQKMEKK